MKLLTNAASSREGSWACSGCALHDVGALGERSGLLLCKRERFYADPKDWLREADAMGLPPHQGCASRLQAR